MRTKIFTIALIAMAFVTGCGHAPNGSGSSTGTAAPSMASTSDSPVTSLDQQGSPPLQPDPKMTPGDTLPVTKDDLCVPGYTKKVRNVPASVKNQVYAEYGIASHAPGEYEVDHLISLELGGSNSIRNLWPQSYKTQPWNAHVKDKLENKLHQMVCTGQIDLPTAQHEIATDWITAYKKYFQTDAPRAPRSGR